MRNTIQILAIAFLFIACEEVVVLDLNEIEKKLVVEASVSNRPGMVDVALSYSQGFYDEPQQVLLTNARVELSSGNGLRELLVLNDQNHYVSELINPKGGTEYTLNIGVDDWQVEVSTTLPEPVPIARVDFVPNPFWGSNDSLNVFVSVNDPKGSDNYFRLMVNHYGMVSPGEYYLLDDTFGKDGIISMPVYYKTFAPGDTVVIRLWHLAPELYSYYTNLSNNIGGSFNSIAPGNPESNLPDDVYGFFKGYSIDQDTIIVPRFSF